MNYLEAQKAMFEHLWNKHQQDNSFTFSVRQNAAKGSEANYFIGTERSKYFSFTCWDTPAYFPGAATDLTDFEFKMLDDGLWQIKFQYFMAKSGTGIQNEGNLYLGPVFQSELKKANIPVNDPDNAAKMLVYIVQPLNPVFKNAEEMIQAFERLYGMVAAPVDSAIVITKVQKHDWIGQRFSQDKFTSLITKLHSRIERHSGDMSIDAKTLPIDPSDIAGHIQPDYPLNTIFYGPPGTGKTYHTINRAVAIANPDFVIEGNTRAATKAEYNRLCTEGQIQFVTFHQSLSYEDFIEGIKPVEPKPTDEYLQYKVEDGIFKRLAEQAAYIPDVQEASVYLNDEAFDKSFFYSLTLNSARVPDDKVIYRYCVDHYSLALNVADGIDVSGLPEASLRQDVKSKGVDSSSANALNRFVHHLKKDNYVFLCDGDSTCKAIGKVTGDYEYHPDSEITPDHFRKVEWLVKDVQIPREQLYADAFALGLERLDRVLVKRDFFTKKTVATKPAMVRKNFVLIIDEINRGNVSQIFGELITLIEEDKRAGGEEVLNITLPYSKKVFNVPSNLYIIGTMNTADRSVEALDTALRRRFTFEEMQPKPELLSPVHLLMRYYNKPKYFKRDWDEEPYVTDVKGLYELLGTSNAIEDTINEQELDDDGRPWELKDFEVIDTNNFTGLNLQSLLTAINKRLAVLLSRDHTIGHAWLMNVYSLEDLRQAFKNKILPLLQEYFYNNYSKINLVLGEKFVKTETVESALFAKSASSEAAGDYAGTSTYMLISDEELEGLSIADFKAIYE